MQSGKTFKAHIPVLCIGKKTWWKNKVFPAYGESEVQEVNRDKVQVWRERNSLNSKVEVNVIDIKQKIVFIALKIEQDILRKKKIYYVENKYKLCEIHGLWDSPMDLSVVKKTCLTKHASYMHRTVHHIYINILKFHKSK